MARALEEVKQLLVPIVSRSDSSHYCRIDSIYPSMINHQLIVQRTNINDSTIFLPPGRRRGRTQEAPTDRARHHQWHLQKRTIGQFNRRGRHPPPASSVFTTPTSTPTAPPPPSTSPIFAPPPGGRGRKWIAHECRQRNNQQFDQRQLSSSNYGLHDAQQQSQSTLEWPP